MKSLCNGGTVMHGECRHCRATAMASNAHKVLESYRYFGKGDKTYIIRCQNTGRFLTFPWQGTIEKDGSIRCEHCNQTFQPERRAS